MEEPKSRDFYAENIYWTALYVLAKYDGQVFNVTIKRKRTVNQRRIMSIEGFSGNSSFFGELLFDIENVQKESDNVAKITKQLVSTLIRMLRKAGWFVIQSNYLSEDFCYIFELRRDAIVISIEEMINIANVLGPHVYQRVLETERFGFYNTVAVTPELIASIELTTPMLLPQPGQPGPEIIQVKKLNPCGTTMELDSEEDLGFTQESWQFVYPD